MATDRKSDPFVSVAKSAIPDHPYRSDVGFMGRWSNGLAAYNQQGIPMRSAAPLRGSEPPGARLSRDDFYAVVGNIQAFIQYRQFNSPLNQAASMYNTPQSGVASAERVFDLLEIRSTACDMILPTGEPCRSAAPPLSERYRLRHKRGPIEHWFGCRSEKARRKEKVRCPL